MNENVSSKAAGNEAAFRFVSYALVFLMMACFVMIISVLIGNVMPDWSSEVMAGLTLLVLIERLYTYKRMKSLVPYTREWTITQGAQWAITVVVIKILLSLANGFDAFAKDISAFSGGNFASLFSLNFFVTLLLVFLVLNISGRFLKLLDEIGLDVPEDLASIRQDIVPVHQRLVNLTLQLGMVMVMLIVLTRVNIISLYNVDGTLRGLSLFSGAEIFAPYYFIFGFILFCLSRLMSLQTRWNLNHIPVASGNMVRQWGIYSFFFLLILFITVGFLSSGGNLGMISVLKILFTFIGRIFYLIGQLLIFLLSIPTLLFGKHAEVRYDVSPTPTPLPSSPTPTPTPQDAALPIDPTLALIKSILLWGVLLVIVIFSISRLAKLHGGFQAMLGKMTIVKWLSSIWQWLIKNVGTTSRALSSAIADTWKRIVSQTTRIFPRPKWINLKSLDPRRQIYFYYLAMIRRGGDQGIARKPAQTPSEYAVTLQDALPTQNEDIHTITESFIEARYSPQPIDSQKANLVKAAWSRIRRALQMWKKPKNEQPIK